VSRLLSLYTFPQRRLLVVLPLVLLASFGVGLVVDTSALGDTVLVATVVMIFATMVGLRLEELTALRSESRLITAATLVNFVWIPLLATVLGLTLLRDQPQLFAGLAIAALLPTSGMTIAWTGLQQGNVAGAVKLTVSGLVLGAVAAPWYLLGMVGEFVPIDVAATFRTIAVVVVVPLILGQVVTRLLLRRVSREEFQRRLKPRFAPLSIWGLLYLVFVTTSMRAEMLVDDLGLIALAVLAVALFYAVNYAVASLVAVKAFERADGVALVNGTVLRNLSIAIGIAATQFEAEAALLITLAFMVQNQSIAYYAKVAGQRWFAVDEATEPAAR